MFVTFLDQLVERRSIHRLVEVKEIAVLQGVGAVGVQPDVIGIHKPLRLRVPLIETPIELGWKDDPFHDLASPVLVHHPERFGIHRWDVLQHFAGKEYELAFTIVVVRRKRFG